MYKNLCPNSSLHYEWLPDKLDRTASLILTQMEIGAGYCQYPLLPPNNSAINCSYLPKSGKWTTSSNKMRIQGHHSQLSGVNRGPPCHITINGRQYRAYIGEVIAAVLLIHGRFPSPTMDANQPGLSGFYCGIGLCYGCQVMVDGRPRRACVTTIRPEMVISTSLDSNE